MSNTDFGEIYSKIIGSKLFKKTYDSVPVSKLISKSGFQLFLPFYHTITHNRLPHIENIYPVRNVKLFEEDLDFYLKHFEAVSIFDIAEKFKKAEKFSKQSFHLTFDDGLSEIYSVIAPILEAKAIPATFFINTDFIDNKDLFYRYKVSLIIEKLKTNNNLLCAIADALTVNKPDFDQVSKALLSLNHTSIALIDSLAEKIELSFDDYLAENKPYLTSEQITDLKARGFAIGSHSANHLLFNDISLEEQKEQIAQSFRILIEKFEINEKYFSFPFSDEGVAVELFDWLYEHERCDLSFGTSGLKHDYLPRHLHRVAIDGSLAPAEEIVKRQYFNYRVKKYFNKNKIIRK